MDCRKPVLVTILVVALLAVVQALAPAPAPAQEPTVSAPVHPLVGTVTAMALNVRSGPGADYDAVGVVRKGDTLSIVGRDSDTSWLDVVKDSLAGWVSARHVSVSGDATTLPVTASRLSITPQVPPPAGQPAGMPSSSSASPAAKGRIVFASDTEGQFDIYSMNLDGGDWKRLTTTGGYNPKYSPDGSLIAYDSPASGNSDIYVMRADGSDAVQLTTDLGSDAYPDWSPDGSQILFVSSRDGLNNLYVMNADGSGQRAMIDTPEVGESEPVWSPDGDKILFTQYIDGNGDGKISIDDWRDSASIGVLYLQTMSIERVTEQSEFHHTMSPIWHPSSYTFLYASLERGQYWHVREMNIDKTGNHEVIASDNSDGPDAISSDGTRILFHSWRHGHWEVYVADADGSNQVLLTNNEDNNHSADWVE